MTCDLDSCLETVASDYPSVFTEFLFGGLISRPHDLPYRMGSIDNSGWCWVVAQNTLYLWNLKAERRMPVSRCATLPLVPNGRQYNASDIVVYERSDSTSPGVMAVSSNGTVRHWRNVTAQFYDTQVNINNETLLSVQIGEPAMQNASARVLLTTTVGSVYTLVDYGQSTSPRLECTLLASYTQSGGIGSRLSTMFFRQSDINDKRALRCLSVINPNQQEKTIVVLGPGHLSAFDSKSVQCAWSQQPDTLLLPSYAEYFKKRARGEIGQLRIVLLDMAPFRSGGIMILAAATHAATAHPVFSLSYYSQVTSAQDSPDWFSVVPLANSQIFSAQEESSFIGQLSLFIPREIGLQESIDYDGCVIVHDSFAQTVHPPSPLRNNEIPVNRAVFFNPDDRFIGQACDNRQTYAFFVKKGVCAIRMLPKGFLEMFPSTHKFFGSPGDMLQKIANKTGKMKHCNEDMKTFLRAFADFCGKKLRECQATLNTMRDVRVCDALHRFMDELLDDHSNFIFSSYPTIDAQLGFRQLIIGRIAFFVKHMHLENKLASARAGVNIGAMSSQGKSGSAVLAEALERISAANAVRKWQTADGNHKSLLDYISQNAAEDRMLQDNSTEFVFLQELTSIHTLPTYMHQFMQKQMGSLASATPSHKMDVLRVAADVLVAMVNAIEKERRNTHGVAVVSVAERWTCGEFSNSLISMSSLVLGAILDTKDVSQMQQKQLVEQVRQLLFFALSDTSERPDGNEAITLLYNVGETSLAQNLAERFKDFRVLVKIALTAANPAEKKKLLTDWKLRFAADNFDTYLYKFYRQKGMNDALLEETGSHADDYISTLEDLRWRREIQNGEFTQAAQSLLSVGDRVTDPKVREGLYVFAKLSALCAGNQPELVTKAEEKWGLVREITVSNSMDTQ